MCGRYTFATDIFEYGKVFGFPLNETYDYFDYEDKDTIKTNIKNLSNHRYNIAPTQYAPVVVSNDEGKNRELAVMRWGLVPSWAKGTDLAHKMINARSETLTDKPSFRDALADRRCFVLADGFYEWKADTVGSKKRPVRFVLKDNKPFVLAGLWEQWKVPDGKGILSTFVIITTYANELVSEWHNRMPVILTPKTADIWMKEARVWDSSYSSVLQPFPSEEMDAYEVSARVNSPFNDDAELIQPI